MILIEGIPVVAARITAEQKAKDWLAKTTSRAPKGVNQASSIDYPPAAVKGVAKAA